MLRTTLNNRYEIQKSLADKQGKNPADLPQKDNQIDLDALNNVSLAFKKWLNKMLANNL